MTPQGDKEVSDTSLVNGSKEDLHISIGAETFDASVVGHKVPTIGIEGLDPIFEAKSHAMNAAIQHMGWGRYQTKLFLLSGFAVGGETVFV
ncbi:hypothetical protein DRE_02729 [Drechslerella stenobrocha 248]|uniref:Uncharacterized protein n=1 Tax=Drechslerella stenobrocha 248 TaxID=1043628 RepID=W7I5U7_9PEZI|nr:hypothetical protein DRE_02729 [Drechslerella stenobrocha 248]